MSAERLFISYSHEDTQWLKRVLPHLAILNAQGSVGVWADKELQPGDRWEDEINAAMRDAEVAVLLVSVDFLNSEFIKKHELPTLLAIINGEQQGRLRRIVPLLVRHCNWESVPELKQLEMRPKVQGKVEALQGLDEHLRDVHLTEFAEQMSKILFDQPKSGEKAASAAGGAPVAIIGSRDYATLERNR